MALPLELFLLVRVPLIEEVTLICFDDFDFFDVRVKDALRSFSSVFGALVGGFHVDWLALTCIISLIIFAVNNNGEFLNRIISPVN